MDKVLVRNADTIAVEINAIKQETQRVVLSNSIEIGRRLVEAKTLVPHGEWGKYLEEKVDYSKSTANQLMKIFEKYGSQQISLIGDNAKSQAIGELSYTQAVLLLGIKDDEERERFIEENKEEIQDSSTRELKKMIAENNKLKDENNRLKEETELNKATVKKNEETINKMLFERNKLKDDVEMVRIEMEEEIKKKEKQYAENINSLNQKIEELKNKPIEVTGIDESKEEEYKQKEEELKKQHKEEIEKLKSQLTSTEEKLSNVKNKCSDEGVIKFKLYYESLKGDINNLINSIEEIKDTDIKDQYKNALNKTLDIIKGRI